MSGKNKARKSTGTRASSTSGSPQSNSTSRTLRSRGSTQANNSQGDSSDSDVPTQPLGTRNQNFSVQGTSASSGLSSRPSTSRAAAAESDDNEQSTSRLSNGRSRNFRRIQAAESSSDTTSDSDEAPGRVKLTQEKDKPKKKRRLIRRKNSSSEASDGDVQPSPSSSRTSLASRSQSSLNQTVSSPDRTRIGPTNMASLVNKFVYYLLIADQKKCLIKKKDIQRHVFTAPEIKSYNDVLERAGNILKETYGMEIVSSAKRKGEYMLINILSHHLGIQEFIDYSPQELQKRGFIFYLLTLIFMNEGSITDGELAVALKPLGIDLNGRLPNPVFGDIHKYLKELVSQNYVERKEINKDPPQYEFTWGERADQEVTKKDLLEFACKIMGDTRPKEWILQYNDAAPKGEEQA